jgi:hypothetical protein
VEINLADLDELGLEGQRARRSVEWFADALSRVSGSAVVGAHFVSGGFGKIHVSAHGQLRGLELTSPASQYRPDRLAVAISDAYAAAHQDAVTQIRGLIARVTDENPSLREFFDRLDAEFGAVSTALHAPDRAAPHKPVVSGWDDEWDPVADPLGRRRKW